MGTTPDSLIRYQKRLIKNGMRDNWDLDGIDKTPSAHWGYAHQAHHCISCSVIQAHQISELADISGYDVNNGGNCILLPARFGHMRLNKEQRHRGQHDEKTYYKYVRGYLDKVYEKYQGVDVDDVCDDEKTKNKILKDLKNTQKKIRDKLIKKTLWLNEWSEKLYKADYREEGTFKLKDDTPRCGHHIDGDSWTKIYPKGGPRRKQTKKGKVRSHWYKKYAFPVPNSIKT